MSAENLKKRLNRTRGWILNILNLLVDTDKIRVTNLWGKIDNILLHLGRKMFQRGCEL